ncbi:SGNH/GDSL hydrolase family protein [Akkermansiaceae bacterium]|nr:SGNH/GDSL hydrolase family protein [Akkermansiaceae bacterium]
MNNRRQFLKFGTAATAVAASSTSGQARKPGSNASGIDGYSYRLPKFAKGSRLLFQGDSITDMKWGRNEKDRNHYLGHSYVYLIASRLGVEMPEAQLDIYNRGMSGHKVGDLRKRWQKDALDMKPDLLSILIGVNDVGRDLKDVDIKTWESDYRHLLDASREANPDLRLVLLDPFVLPSGRLALKDTFKRWRDQVEHMIVVVTSLAKDYQAVHLRTQQIFDAAAEAVSPEHWIWDGVHPLPQGHELIARNWIQEVSGRWG